MFGQCVQQVGHHFKVDHRGFIDDQDVQRQAIASVMPKMPRAGAAAQQAVNGGDITGDFLPNLVVHFQRFNLQADGLGQARSGFARGRCQADSQGSARFNRRGLEQRQ